ncbi:MAG: molybdate transport system substrate-binding protein [Alphaproteobacteria bacterium]|nr:molybdate transport system substrate-binding protein [Alphaproteobacteria bacterium]
MRIGSRIFMPAAAGILSLLISGATVRAAEIVLMTTGAVEQIMKGLIPTFETATGHKVTMTVLGTGPAVAKIKEGAFADLILLGPDALDDLAKAGKVNAATVAPAFKSRIGFAVRAGAKKPDISTAESLKKALLDAQSIGFSTGPSGEHFSKVVIVKLGIADQVRPKMKNVPGDPVGVGVANGVVEVGIHQIAELLPIPGIDVVGDLPADLNTTIIYATGLTPMVKQPEAAKELVKYLALPASAPVIRKNGMNPV